MIYPTRLTVLLAAAVAPAALVIGIFYPAYWTSGLALLALLAALVVVDGLIGAAIRDAEVECDAPAAASVGETFAIVAHLRFRRAAPAAVEVAVGVSGPVEAPFGWRAAAEMTRHEGAAAVVLKAERRGTAVLDAVWLRWPGPLGLAWKQRRLGLARAVLITPDIRQLRERRRWSMPCDEASMARRVTP